MAVTKAIIKAVPYVNSNNKVDKWDLQMKYENNSEGDATYYTHTFGKTINQQDITYDGDGNVVETITNFTLKAKGSWTKDNLEALLPISTWDSVFASQVDSVITNPPAESTPDEAFSVPS